MMVVRRIRSAINVSVAALDSRDMNEK